MVSKIHRFARFCARPTYQGHDDDDDVECDLATELFGGKLKKLRGLSVSILLARCTRVERTEGVSLQGTYYLANRLTCGLDSTPGRDEFTINDFGPRASHQAHEAFVGYYATVEVDL